MGKIQHSFHNNNKSTKLSKLKTRNFTEMAGNSNLAKKMAKTEINFIQMCDVLYIMTENF